MTSLGEPRTVYLCFREKSHSQFFGLTQLSLLSDRAFSQSDRGKEATAVYVALAAACFSACASTAERSIRTWAISIGRGVSRLWIRGYKNRQVFGTVYYTVVVA